MKRLWAWADAHYIDEKKRLPRDKSWVTNLQELYLYGNELTELQKKSLTCQS